MGLGEASVASSHRVSEEDTIGSHSKYKDKDTRSKGNFPRIKKTIYDHETNLGGFAERYR